MAKQNLNSLESVRELERELALPDGWYQSLLRVDESDWSFVIKLHALFEAATAHAINEALNRPQMKVFVERLNMRGTVSKTALGKALGVLDRQCERFVDALSRIRNDCIHDVRNVAFKFDGYVDGLDDSSRQQLFGVFERSIGEKVAIPGGGTISRLEFVKQHMRISLWVAGARLLADIYVEKQRAAAISKGIQVMTIGDLFAKGKLAASPSLLLDRTRPAKKK